MQMASSWEKKNRSWSFDFQWSLISFFIFLNTVSMLHKLSYYSIMTPIKYPYDRGQLHPAGFFSPFEPSALSFVLSATEKYCSLKDKEMRNIRPTLSICFLVVFLFFFIPASLIILTPSLAGFTPHVCDPYQAFDSLHKLCLLQTKHSDFMFLFSAYKVILQILSAPLRRKIKIGIASLEPCSLNPERSSDINNQPPNRNILFTYY